MHNIDLITTIAAGLTCAWICGLITQRIGLSPIVGYLLGGVLVGPYTPGFTADHSLATQLAEIGVILLMFGVGLHFHLKDLIAVKDNALPGATIHTAIATLLGLWVATTFGWGTKPGLVIGMAMAVASTVVLVRVLMDNEILETTAGHAAVGWLIVEDILSVFVLVLIPAIALESGGASALTLAIGTAVFKIAALSALVLVAGGRVIPWVLVMVARLRSRELFTLTVLVIAIAIAAGSYALFGVSMALGAFLAGMVVGQTPVSQQAGADALPMRDAFSVLFFVSVGMLFDPMFLLREPVLVLACLTIIMIGKPLAAFVIVAALGYSTRTALIIAIAMGQIGEFSFILADAGKRAGILPGEGHSTLVACAIVSITFNPLLFKLIGPLEEAIKKSPRLWRLLNARAERAQHAANAAAANEIASQTKPLAVVVGYGPVGRTVDRLLRGGGLETVVIDMNMDTILELRKEGRLAIFGDASHDAILTEAGIARAEYFVITLPHSANRTPMITVARQLNPNARIHVRARYLIERRELEQLGAHFVCFEEAESAISLARAMLAEFGATPEKIKSEVDTIREELGNRGSEAWRAT